MSLDRGPSLLRRVFGERKRHEPKTLLAEAAADERVGSGASLFGEFGEKGERVGEQIAYFISRLDELYSLRQEFASVAKPMQDFIVSHAEAQTRLAESTALLARERTDSQAVRSEVKTLRAQFLRADNELAEARNQIKIHEETVENRTAQFKVLQIAHDDFESKLEFVVRQLASEEQANRDHSAMRLRLDEEFSRIEQELAFEKARFLELKDQNEGDGVELRRLQGLADRLQPALVTAKRRIADLENDLVAAGASQSMLELKIASEQELRRATEAARSQERIAFENETTALTVQTEALESRYATTARIFEQSRALVNEKIDQVRQLERLVKDAQTERAAAERRLAQALEEVRRLTDQVTTLGTRHQDAQERGGMLTNAMAAKDAQIDQLEARCAAMKHQIEDVTARHEEELVAVEIRNRKLIEEVQGERAERALAQGALSIARNSREKLLVQIEDLKRHRVPRTVEEDEVAQTVATNASNIHRLREIDSSEGA